MFIDEAQIQIASGDGGDGVVHFRREKYVPHGGPDGGDGGKGGDVVFEVSTHLTTLSKFRNRNRFIASKGSRGGGSNKTGASGEDVLIKVPPGTLVYDEEQSELLADLTEVDQRITLLKGGRGGRGNARFKSSRNQAPRVAERGEPGESLSLRLELRLLADVGIVGVPNAGKSTLLAAVTGARPKIAAYPFTTLHPNLGVADLDYENQLVLADIPGLIEGAHEGVGLGATFLRHIQRTRVLIHLINGLSDNPLADFSQVNSELSLFDETLGLKPQVVVLNKIDIPEVKERQAELEKAFQGQGIKIMSVSALARIDLKPLLWAAHHALEETEPAEVESEIPVYRVEEDPESFNVWREEDGAWRVKGKAIERAAAMTYWEYDEAVRRFQRILEHLGVEAALRKAGARAEDTIRIGEHELEWLD
jgi:GTP-binding protein